MGLAREIVFYQKYLWIKNSKNILISFELFSLAVKTGIFIFRVFGVFLTFHIYGFFMFLPSSSFISFFSILTAGERKWKRKIFSFFQGKNLVWDTTSNEHVATFLLNIGNFYRFLCIGKKNYKITLVSYS